MIAYKHILSKKQHDEMILCFEKGLYRWSNTPKTCIHALTICNLELPLSMTKLLQSIILKLSQIASNVRLSLHILEFLSALIQIPDLYINFVEADYKRLFGIALQYVTFRPVKGKNYFLSVEVKILNPYF